MCAENDTKTEKLTDSIQELRRLLEEASAKYGEMETQHKEKVLMLNEEISKRDVCIQNLKREVEDANQLLEVTKQGRYSTNYNNRYIYVYGANATLTV